MSPPNDQDPENALTWLGQEWARALAGVVESMAGERPKTSWQAAGGESLPAEALIWEQPFDLAAGAVMWAVMPQAAAKELGEHVLASAGVEQAEAEEAAATAREILAQAFAGLAQAISARLERTVNALPGQAVDQLPEQAVEAGSVTLVFSEGEIGPLHLACSQALVEAFQTPETDDAAPAEDGLRVLASPTLDLLRNVELPVSISFGRTRMPLQEVLKLTAGSVIELNRSINDPVALIVNNTVVAVGDVVVIEGNYGLRIKEILSCDKLLRTSGLV